MLKGPLVCQFSVLLLIAGSTVRFCGVVSVRHLIVEKRPFKCDVACIVCFLAVVLLTSIITPFGFLRFLLFSTFLFMRESNSRSEGSVWNRKLCCCCCFVNTSYLFLILKFGSSNFETVVKIH